MIQFEDRPRLWNPAVLPDGWTLKNLLADHPSTPFNPDIANVFFRAGEIETWGRGIPGIFRQPMARIVPFLLAGFRSMVRSGANEKYPEVPPSGLGLFGREALNQHLVGGQSRP